MRDVNKDELFMIYKTIKAEPEAWYQGEWAKRLYAYADTLAEEPTYCGTAMCFAGHAVVRAGDTLLFPHADSVSTTSCLTAEGEERQISTRAREILGLSEVQGDILFCGGNDLDNIRWQIKHLTGVDPESVV